MRYLLMTIFLLLVQLSVAQRIENASRSTTG